MTRLIGIDSGRTLTGICVVDRDQVRFAKPRFTQNLTRFGALAHRIGPRLLMSIGPPVSCCGLILITRLSPQTSYGDSYADPVRFLPGFRVAIWICAGLLTAGGVLAALTSRNPRAPVAPARTEVPVCVSLAGEPPPATTSPAGAGSG